MKRAFRFVWCLVWISCWLSAEEAVGEASYRRDASEISVIIGDQSVSVREITRFHLVGDATDSTTSGPCSAFFEWVPLGARVAGVEQRSSLVESPRIVVAGGNVGQTVWIGRPNPDETESQVRGKFVTRVLFKRCPIGVLCVFEYQYPIAALEAVEYTLGPNLERREPGAIASHTLGGILRIVNASSRHFDVLGGVPIEKSKLGEIYEFADDVRIRVQ